MNAQSHSQIQFLLLFIIPYFMRNDQKGHGTAAGTIYFSCWAGVFYSLDITTLNILRLVQENEKKKLIDSVGAAPTPEEAAAASAEEVVDPSFRETKDETGLDSAEFPELEMSLDLEERIVTPLRLPRDHEQRVDAPLLHPIGPVQFIEAADICDDDVTDAIECRGDAFTRKPVSESLRSEPVFFSAQEENFDDDDDESTEKVPSEGYP
jgi:hypothetical protein